MHAYNFLIKSYLVSIEKKYSNIIFSKNPLNLFSVTNLSGVILLSVSCN